ncbi:hypothetical protein KEM55_000876, partial [Ascosphaera atra]
PLHPSPFPPQRLPLRHRLPLHPERGRRLETRHHHQADPARHTRPPGRAQPQFPGPERRIQSLQEGPRGLREESAPDRQGELYVYL